MPLCETTLMDNSEVLSNMSNMMAQILKMMQEIFEVLPPNKVDFSDVHNLDHENPCTIDDHNEINGEIQLELVTEDHEDELNIVEPISNRIYIVVELTINLEVKDELTTNIQPKSILNESVEDPIHFLAMVEKVPTNEVEKFVSFSFENDIKA
ncbi:hypothetical protein PVK06_004625 [Gossypium arboreum]|uniref:Uncharacterized protein n=1 Tax=Gossypium arboreum TaxID=29729 RepID=A0ABR0QSH5_GOSAR|nr:hypothetical protein PVK06_004625 [Gossypium arboreum]